MIPEIILPLISPNIYFHKIKYTTNKETFLTVMEYEINELLCILLFIRLYVLLRSLINFSKYFSARALRVAKMMGVKLSRLFAIRCLLQRSPTIILSATIVSFTFACSYMLKIIEGPFHNTPLNKRLFNDYSKIENCIWTVLVTMTTGKEN